MTEHSSKTRHLGDSGFHQPFERKSTKTVTDVVPWVIQFRVVGTPSMITAQVQSQMLLGRQDPTSGINPDVDLNPYGAQQKGVSRQHAALGTQDNRVHIRDLNSANGTFINGKYLTPGKQYRLKDGDRLHLGSLELQVHLVVKPITQDDTLIGMTNDLGIPQIGKGMNLLLVNDDPDVIQVLKRFVEIAGFKVMIAGSAGEAIMMIDHYLPDLAVLELQLADGDGLDIVRYVRERLENNTMPLIGITDPAAEYKIRQALEHGMDMFLGKPIAVEELMDGLTNMMEALSRNS